MSDEIRRCGPGDIPMADDMPKAVWEGTLFGVRVYVLDDGRRIVNAEDVQRILTSEVDFDLADFGEAFAKFMRGETHSGDGR